MRLSVIIPAVGEQVAIDATLLSVLENRPPFCELIVPCGFDYRDPYDLSGEVRFEPCDEVTWNGLCNHAVQVASTDVVAVLLPATEVAYDWWQTPVSRLRNHSQLGSVSPVLKDPQTEWGIAGLNYTLGGDRKYERVALEDTQQDGFRVAIDGPCKWAGFYRRSMLLDLAGWDQSVTPQMADLELAVRMHRAGWQSDCVVDTVFQVPRRIVEPISRWREARDIERIFWRYLDGSPTLPALAAHAVEVSVGRLRRFFYGQALGEFAGRIAGVIPANRAGFQPMASETYARAA